MKRPELGKGWAFPIRIDAATGGIAMVEAADDVEEAIRVVLGTRLGERVMRSRFGSEVPGILFEAATPSTAGRLSDAIRTALASWEPRIDVLDVLVQADPDIATRFVASLTYRLRENNAVLNQVYPFYVSEGEER